MSATSAMPDMPDPKATMAIATATLCRSNPTILFARGRTAIARMLAGISFVILLTAPPLPEILSGSFPLPLKSAFSQWIEHAINPWKKKGCFHAFLQLTRCPQRVYWTQHNIVCTVSRSPVSVLRLPRIRRHRRAVPSSQWQPCYRFFTRASPLPAAGQPCSRLPTASPC